MNQFEKSIERFTCLNHLFHRNVTQSPTTTYKTYTEHDFDEAQNYLFSNNY